jgi:hypothetical protein
MAIFVTRVVPAKAVSFPNAQTTLAFDATADPGDRRVDVLYTITTPGVTFANGTTEERLNGHPVRTSGTRVSRAVRLVRTDGDAPIIEVMAQIREVPGGDTQEQGWAIGVITGGGGAALDAMAFIAESFNGRRDGLSDAELAHAETARGILQVLLVAVDELLEREGRRGTSAAPAAEEEEEGNGGGTGISEEDASPTAVADAGSERPAPEGK